MAELWLKCEDGGRCFRSGLKRSWPHYCRVHAGARRKEGFGPKQMKNNPDRKPTPEQCARWKNLHCDPGV